MILKTTTDREADAICEFVRAFDSVLYLTIRLGAHYRIFNLIPRNQ